MTISIRPANQDLPPFDVKDYEERSVPMPKSVMDILKKLQQESETGNPFVFLSKNRYELVQEKWAERREQGKGGDWVNRDLVNNCLRNFKKHCKDAGIKTNEKLNLHCLRKSYATNLANAGTPAHTLMKLMGHSSLSTTQKYYLHSSDANERKAIEALELLVVRETAAKND